jgi:hypothetical protein
MSLFSLSMQFSYNGYPVYKVSPHENTKEGRVVMRMIYIPDVDVHGRSPDIQAKLYANRDLLDAAVFAVYEANMKFLARLSSNSPLSVHHAKTALTMTVDRLVGEGVPPDMQERMNVFFTRYDGGQSMAGTKDDVHHQTFVFPRAVSLLSDIEIPLFHPAGGHLTDYGAPSQDIQKSNVPSGAEVVLIP